jgi:hypothetical protein
MPPKIFGGIFLLALSWLHLEPVVLAQMYQQTVGGLFNHIEYALKALFATKIRVRHFTLRAGRCKFQKQADLVFEA